MKIPRWPPTFLKLIVLLLVDIITAYNYSFWGIQDSNIHNINILDKFLDLYSHKTLYKFMKPPPNDNKICFQMSHEYQ